MPRSAAKTLHLPPDVFDPDCPTRRLIDRVGDRWTILVFLALAEQSLRFNELRRTLRNVSQKMLTQTLRHLEADGFVLRTVVATVPVTVSYELTPLGRSLLGVIEQLRAWAYANVKRGNRPTGAAAGQAGAARPGPA